MSYRLEDGTGSRSKAAVFKNRVRVFAEEISLVNYQSVKSGNITQEQILNGEVIGTFTVEAQNTISFGAGIGKIFTLFITNNDLINLLVIDRAYIQITSFTLTLPISSLTVAIDNIVPATPIVSVPITNENLSSNIIPLISTGFKSTTVGGSISSRTVPSIFPTLGNIEDFISSGSDAIILAAGKTINISIFFQNLSGNSISYNSFIRFAMISPGDTG